MNISRNRLISKALKRALIGVVVTAAMYGSMSFVTAVEQHYTFAKQCEADVFCND